MFSLLLPGAVASASPTYYVDGALGDDTRSAAQAVNPVTPWKTIKKAVSAGGLLGMISKGVVLDGYTVVIAPGLYLESVESKRDGLSTAPVTIKAATAGTVTIQPPAGLNGVFVSHHYHVIDGLVVTGGNIGLKVGPASGNGAGIKFTNVITGLAMHNVVFGNSRDKTRPYARVQLCVAVRSPAAGVEGEDHWSLRAQGGQVHRVAGACQGHGGWRGSRDVQEELAEGYHGDRTDSSAALHARGT